MTFAFFRKGAFFQPGHAPVGNLIPEIILHLLLPKSCTYCCRFLCTLICHFLCTSICRLHQLPQIIDEMFHITSPTGYFRRHRMPVVSFFMLIKVCDPKTRFGVSSRYFCMALLYLLKSLSCTNKLGDFGRFRKK